MCFLDVAEPSKSFPLGASIFVSFHSIVVLKFFIRFFLKNLNMEKIRLSI